MWAGVGTGGGGATSDLTWLGTNLGNNRVNKDVFVNKTLDV